MLFLLFHNLTEDLIEVHDVLCFGVTCRVTASVSSLSLSLHLEHSLEIACNPASLCSLSLSLHLEHSFELLPM